MRTLVLLCGDSGLHFHFTFIVDGVVISSKIRDDSTFDFTWFPRFVYCFYSLQEIMEQIIFLQCFMLLVWHCRFQRSLCRFTYGYIKFLTLVLQNREKVRCLWIWELNAFIEATPALQWVIFTFMEVLSCFLFCTLVTNSDDEFFFLHFLQLAFSFIEDIIFCWAYYPPSYFLDKYFLKWGILL